MTSFGRAQFIMDDASLEDLLNGIDGPVGMMLLEVSEKMAAYAKGAAPVLKPENIWTASDRYGEYPGYTKDNTHSKIGYGKSGKLYGGVNAPMGPTLFLEKPAKQLHHTYPFLSSSIYAGDI